VLAAAIDSDANSRETFWPAYCRRQSGVATLTPLRWHSSGNITSLATANALIRAGGGTKSLPPGSHVELFSDRSFGLTLHFRHQTLPPVNASENVMGNQRAHLFGFLAKVSCSPPTPQNARIVAQMVAAPFF